MKNTSKILALVLVVMTVLMSLSALTVSAAAPEKLYLTPSANWKQSNARFAAYFFGNGEKWVSMTDPDGDGVYEVEVPAGYPSVIFCRMNPSASANNWNNKWNQTSDLTVPTDGPNHYTVKEGTWDKGGGTWSTFGSTCLHANLGPAATCTTPQECLDCGDPVVSELGHSYNTAHLCTRCNEQATFTVAGSGAHLGTEWDTGNTANDMTYADGVYTKVYTNVAAGTYMFKVARDHDWGTAYPSADKTYTVSTAGSTVTITLKGTTVTVTVEVPHTHSWSDATCTEPQKCECGETQGEALGHTWGEWVVDTPATEESEGSKHRDCSVCEETETAIMPTLQHVHSWTIPATCTEPEKCVCGEENGEALGHTWSDATCTTPKTCSVCNTTEGTTLDHTYVNGVCSCGAKDPNYVDYYLIGYINGKDYGNGDDWANLGEYKFVDGKLVVTFTGDSYVGIKSAKLDGTIAKWYWCAKYTEAKEATLIADNPEKMKVPGNVEITFTLTVNADGTLTLVADYHTHTFSKATCTEPAKCECGVTQGNALGHDKVVDVEAKAPTCTEAGNTEGSHCSRCDAETVVSTEIPATGHYYYAGYCAVCYAPEFVPGSHKLVVDAEFSAGYKNTIVRITEAGHYNITLPGTYALIWIYTTEFTTSNPDDWADATAGNWLVRSENGHAYLEPGDYIFGIYSLGLVPEGEYTLNISKVDCTTKEVTVDPTCTAEGSYIKSCELCGHVFEQKVLPAAGHTEVVDAKVDATCTETGLTEGKHCSVCNEVIVAQTEVPSLRHDWSNGNECSRCGTPKCVHEWVDEVVDPTCVKDGYTLHTCSKCGENYKDTTVPATGSHTWVETVVPPTCTEAGSKTNTCSVCEETKTEEIPALGHTFTNGYCVCGAAEFVPGVHVLNVDATLAGGYKNTVVRISEAGMYRIHSNSIAIIWIYTTELSTSNPEDWPSDPNQGNWLIRSETGYAYLEPGDYIFGIYCLGIVPVGEYTLTIEAHTEHTFVEGKCACGEEDPTYVPDEPGTEDPGQQPGDDKPGDDKPGDEPTTPAPELTLWDKIVAFLKKILDMILGFFKK